MNYSIKIRESGCYGSCIPKEYTIKSDGTVVYEERPPNINLGPTKHTPIRTNFKLNKNELGQVLKSIAESNFFDYPNDKYVEPTYDAQRITVVININGIERAIEYSNGYVNSNVPAGLKKLRHDIYDIIKKNLPVQ